MLQMAVLELLVFKWSLQYDIKELIILFKFLGFFSLDNRH